MRAVEPQPAPDNGLTRVLREQVRQAASNRTPLSITGGGSKAFYGRRAAGEPLSVREHRGIVHYEPIELVVTARAGTPLVEIEAELARQGQMLPFEPPRFSPNATLGGTVATGLSGPRRPYAGAVRDAVLGVRIINGNGEPLRFGGEVMKNVAGYDVSRAMVGALGTLGLITEASLKVLPRPAAEITLMQERNEAEALALMNRWAGLPLPLSATAYHDGRLYVRLSAASSGVQAARRRIGGDPLEAGDGFWEQLREQTHPFFRSEEPLWRLSVPSTTPPAGLPGETFVEWGGAQRWLRSRAAPETVRQWAEQAGGHATLFRNGDRSGAVFHPLPGPLLALHRSLKRAFDPQGILNPGRLYREI